MGHDRIGICNDPSHNPEPGPILYIELRFNERIPLVSPFEFPEYLNVLRQIIEERLQECVDHIRCVNSMGTEADDDRLSSIQPFFEVRVGLGKWDRSESYWPKAVKIRWQDTGVIGFWDAAAEYVDIVAGRRLKRRAPL